MATKTPPQRPAPLDPHMTGYAHGRRFITGYWPSSRDDKGPWPMTVDDTGHVISHRCPASEAGRACWHEVGDQPTRLVLAYWATVYADWEPRELAKERDWLAHYTDGWALDQADQDAALLQLQAVAALLGERAQEGAAA